MITYKKSSPRNIRVYLEKKWVGDIIMTFNGTYFYAPKRALPGKEFKTIEEVKKSLENES